MEFAGEKPEPGRVSVFALVLTLAIVAIGIVTVYGPQGSFLAATDVAAEEPIDRLGNLEEGLGNVEFATDANAALVLEMVNTINLHTVALKEAALAFTTLQAQTHAQRDEIATLRGEIAAARAELERKQKPRARRSVPHTPAASDFKLQ